MIDQLYQLFLKARLGSAWEKEEIPQIRRWILKNK